MLSSLSPVWGIAICLIAWVAAIKDLRSYTIPHIYPFVTIILFVISLSFVEFSLSFLGWRVLSAAIAFLVGFLMFVGGIMGGGDVKLFAALALWFPLKDLPIVVILMTFLGLFYTLAVLGYRMLKNNQADTTSSEKLSFMARFRQQMRSKLPYGPAIALGVTAYLYQIGF